MNNEYWKKLIEAGVPIYPVIPGQKKPLYIKIPDENGLTTVGWKRFYDIENWKAFKDVWLTFAEGREAVIEACGGDVSRWLPDYTPETLPEEFGFGLICRAFGGVALDFDSDSKETFSAWLRKMSQEAPDLLDRVYIEKTPHGFHVVFRTAMEKHNEKLAERPSIKGKLDKNDDPEDLKEKQTLIETRAGSGGFLVLAPTPRYAPMRGDLTNLPILADKEVHALYRVSRSFSHFPPPIPRAEKTDWRPRDTFDHTGWTVCDPYTRYTSQFTLTDWRQLLERYGWRFLKQTPDGRYWYQRPGKAPGDKDHSCNLKYCDGCWVLYTYTTNSALPEDEGLTGIRFLQHQVCGGDFKKAISLAAKFMCGARLCALGMLCNNN